jgi:hypothetical protein
MANIFTNIALLLKGGKITVQAAELAAATKTLRLNVASKIDQYRAANGNITQDMKSILRDLDRVTERAADVVDTIGLDSTETKLRGFIKPEMYN